MTEAAVLDEAARLRDELARIVYVVSHDFSEPVQVASGCAQILAVRYEGRLDPDADRLLEAIARSGRRMQAMIDDLLAYSRIDRRPLQPRPVNCAGALAEACTRLAGAIEAAGAEIGADPLPTVAGEADQIERVFENLLSNAIRFRGQAPPVIKVTADAEPDCWRLSVQDNGRGVDPAEHERIFELFRVGEPGENPAGRGLGLAVCKKIVARHAGRMLVDSVPGEGATFQFTLPAAESLM